MPDDRRQHIEVEGAGHYGIFSGRRWRQTVYPQVRDFIRAQDQRRSNGRGETATSSHKGVNKD